MHPLGQTRTTIQTNHAFIAPDGHVKSSLIGWTSTQCVILVSPQLMERPRFLQYLAYMENGGTAGQPAQGVQRFIYVIAGSLEVKVSGQTQALDKGHFSYIPADTNHSITARSDGTQILVFEKIYQPSILSNDYTKSISGDAWAVEGIPFLGDNNARLRPLLPDISAFDMAVNLFTFETGAALPFVETHIMEHGLYLLEGQGVYRLDESWYPIQTGDAIWMGPFCPQWFCAIGKTQSTYIYYKDINRDPFHL